MKNIIKVGLPLFLIAISAYNIYINQKTNIQSDLFWANVEALANSEDSGNKRTCFTKWKKAPNDDSLAFWDWICSECEAYWLLEGSIRGDCQ